MLTPQTIRPFYQDKVRPILVDPGVPIEVRKELVFRYVELATDLKSRNIRELKDKERNVKALVKEIEKIVTKEIDRRVNT